MCDKNIAWTHAAVRCYGEDEITFVPVTQLQRKVRKTVIFHGKKKLAAVMRNFSPMNERDFSENTWYRLSWLCLEGCTVKHQHNKQTYACIVLNLGTSIEDARERQLRTRSKFPNQVFSEDSMSTLSCSQSSMHSMSDISDCEGDKPSCSSAPSKKVLDRYKASACRRAIKRSSSQSSLENPGGKERIISKAEVHARPTMPMETSPTVDTKESAAKLGSSNEQDSRQNIMDRILPCGWCDAAPMKFSMFSQHKCTMNYDDLGISLGKVYPVQKNGIILHIPPSEHYCYYGDRTLDDDICPYDNIDFEAAINGSLAENNGSTDGSSAKDKDTDATVLNDALSATREHNTQKSIELETVGSTDKVRRPPKSSAKDGDTAATVLSDALSATRKQTHESVVHGTVESVDKLRRPPKKQFRPKPLPVNLTPSGLPLNSLKDGQVYLGLDIHVDADVWEINEEQRKFTIFLRNLATIIWPAPDLVMRAFDLSKAKTKPLGREDEPRVLFETEKWQLLLAQYEKRLRDQQLPEKRVRYYLKNVNRVIGQLITDLRSAHNKAYKKKMTQNPES